MSHAQKAEERGEDDQAAVAGQYTAGKGRLREPGCCQANNRNYGYPR